MLTTKEKSYLGKAFIAELLGSAALVGGCTAVIAKWSDTLGQLLASTVVCAAIVTSVIYVFGKYSGGHANPMVTLGFATAGRMKWSVALMYLIAQIIGAIIAVLVCAFFFGGLCNLEEFNTGSLFEKDNVKLVLLVALMTAIFVGSFLFITRNPFLASIGGLAIGIVFAITSFIGLEYSGQSLNPLYLLFSKGNSKAKVLIILGGIIGAVIAGFIYRLMDWCPNKRHARDCNGNKLYTKCCRPIIEVEHEVLNECGEKEGKCTTEKFCTYEVKPSKHDHHQRNFATSMLRKFETQTGMTAEQLSNTTYRAAMKGTYMANKASAMANKASAAASTMRTSGF